MQAKFDLGVVFPGEFHLRRYWVIDIISVAGFKDRINVE